MWYEQLNNNVFIMSLYDTVPEFARDKEIDDVYKLTARVTVRVMSLSPSTTALPSAIMVTVLPSASTIFALSE